MKREQLYRKIKKEMPQDLNELEKAAYIMKAIAENREFSAKYYWSNRSERIRMYNHARGKNNVKLQDKKELICITASRLYKYISEKFGLDVYYTGDSGKITKNNFGIFKNEEHISPVIRLEDGRFIKTDVEWDLENIQTGSRWLKFGTKDASDIYLSEIQQSEIDEIMKKIGYINDENDYTNVYCDEFCREISNLNNKDKLERLFNDEFINERVQNLNGCVEVFRFYRVMMKNMTRKNVNGKLENDYNKNIFIFAACLKNKRKDKKYTLCTYLKNQSENQQPDIWMYSCKSKKMTSVSLPELKYFMETDKLKFIQAKTGETYYDFLEQIKNNEPARNQKNNIREMVR